MISNKCVNSISKHWTMTHSIKFALVGITYGPKLGNAP